MKQEAHATAAAMRDQAVKAEKALAGVKSEITVKSTELAQVEAKLAAARDAVAKMLR
jgi:hypothetical protein